MNAFKISCLVVCLASSWVGLARTQSLEQAIGMALESNPTIAAAQANLALSYEQRTGAGAAGRMRVQASASATQRSDNTETVSFAGQESQQSRTSLRNVVGVNLSQPVYTGGRLSTNLALADKRIEAAKIGVANSELTLARNIGAAYAELVRAETVNSALANSVTNLGMDLAGANARFRAGEVSITDVAQSESRLAQVQGLAARSLSDVTAARANFERFVGSPPFNIDQNLTPPALPATQSELVDAVLAQNLEIQAARARFATAQASVRSAATARNPSVTIDAGYERRANEAFSGSRGESTQIGARVVVPLWDGGAASSGVRQALSQASIARYQLADLEQDVRARTTSAWANYAASAQILAAAQRQVEAAQLARRGALAELRFGLRSTIEALNQEVELRQALTNLATAKRDNYVAAIDIMALMGLTPLGKRPRSLDPIARSALPEPQLPPPLPIERPIHSVLEFLEANDQPVSEAARELNQWLEPSKAMGPLP